MAYVSYDFFGEAFTTGTRLGALCVELFIDFAFIKMLATPHAHNTRDGRCVISYRP
jgi:hypothetical protein